MNILRKIFSKFYQKKILIIVSGKVTKLDLFKEALKKFESKVVLASFSDVNFVVNPGDGVSDIKVGESSLIDFDLIYFRMVGKSLEQATILANFAVKNKITIVDKLYTNNILTPLSLAKSIEMKKLVERGIQVPKTLFGDLSLLTKKSSEYVSFPQVIKSTTGKKAREVWLVKNKKELSSLTKKIKSENIDYETSYYMAQELIKATQRVRVLVIGGKAVGAITRPTKWRRMWETREDKWKSDVVNPIPRDLVKLAVDCAKACNIQICGVDILIEDKTGKAWVIEANAAPAWKLINKYCGISIEEEILKFLIYHT